MPALASQATLAAIVRRLDPAAELIGCRRLQGGVSATVLALDIRDGEGQERRVVLRNHGAADLAWNPRVAAQEHALLAALHAAGQPVPRPLLLDESGSLLRTPYVVVSFVEGDGVAPADPAPALAARLAAIHALPTAALPTAALPPLPRRETQVARLLGESQADPDYEEIRAALAATEAPAAETTLLHGDFWPGNVIWDAGEAVAVIDWEDAAIGPPLADLAGARLELLWSHGGGAMAAFTLRYLAASGVEVPGLPYWDLVAALDKLPRLGAWGLRPDAAAAMRAAGLRFAAAALAALRAG